MGKRLQNKIKKRNAGILAKLDTDQTAEALHAYTRCQLRHAEDVRSVREAFIEHINHEPNAERQGLTR